MSCLVSLFTLLKVCILIFNLFKEKNCRPADQSFSFVSIIFIYCGHYFCVFFSHWFPDVNIPISPRQAVPIVRSRSDVDLSGVQPRVNTCRPRASTLLGVHKMEKGATTSLRKQKQKTTLSHSVESLNFCSRQQALLSKWMTGYGEVLRLPEWWENTFLAGLHLLEIFVSV